MTAKAWLPLVLGLCGCAGLGLAPRPAKLGGVTMARETFIAPEAVLRVRWSRPLVLSQAFFAYNPQEFATAALSPDGQTVFVGSSAKVLYALRQRDGEVLWRHQLTGGLASEPLYVPAANPLTLTATTTWAELVMDPEEGAALNHAASSTAFHPT